MNWTPGPLQALRVSQQYGCYSWVINRRGFEFEGNSQGQGRTLAWLPTDDEETRANAILYSLAPELAEALQSLAQLSVPQASATKDVWIDRGQQWVSLIEKARSLLAKLEGGEK